MKFAKRVFFWSGIYGLIALIPQYFMEGKVGRDFPPPITHAEYFYGFVGVGLAWQILFLILSKDPIRFRPMMIPGALEKIGFGVAVIVLYIQGRLNPTLLVASGIDLLMATLFFVAYYKTSSTYSAVART